MKKTSMTLVLSLGIALASCSKEKPGVESAEVDALKTRNAELETAVKTLSTQLRTINEEQVQIKKIMSDVADSVSEQSGSLDQVNAKVDTGLRETNEALGTLKEKVVTPAGSRRSVSPSRPSANTYSSRNVDAAAKAKLTPKATVKPVLNSSVKTVSRPALKTSVRTIARPSARSPAKRATTTTNSFRR